MDPVKFRVAIPAADPPDNALLFDAAVTMASWRILRN
jgi:hypothetical protein